MIGVTIDDILSIDNDQLFNEMALRIFRFQAENTNVYRRYLEFIGTDPLSVKSIDEIPFLPVEFFKDHQILGEDLKQSIQYTFSSSSTTGIGVSKHHYADISWYEKSFSRAFEQFVDTRDLEISALLPGYLERNDSALIYMVNRLMEKYNESGPAFYLHDHEALVDRLRSNTRKGKRNLLIGVTHALLTLSENFPYEFDMQVMETGGMKGQRKELTPREIHDQLKQAWGLRSIMGEYGMTELSSQAYSRADGIFRSPNWMRISIRERDDPFSSAPQGRTGGINVIDLANAESCSFIATSDLGRVHSDDSFEVLGRFDHSDIRGCNLLVVNE